jgi:hypothetical protein
MTRKQLQELGFNVKAELGNDDIGYRLFVVEDGDGDLQVLHSYLSGLYRRPAIEVFFFSSFKKRDQDRLRKQPDNFLYRFDRQIIYTIPDVFEDEETWVKNIKRKVNF